MRYEIFVLDLIADPAIFACVPMLFVLDVAFIPTCLCLLLSTLVCPIPLSIMFKPFCSNYVFRWTPLYAAVGDILHS